MLAILFKVEIQRLRSLQGWLKIVGILAAVAGAVVVVALGSKEGGGEKLILGNICLVINCMSMAIYILLQRRVLGARRPPPPRASPSSRSHRAPRRSSLPLGSCAL